MNAYCDRQSVDMNAIAFLFDGRRLRGEQTPDEVRGTCKPTSALLALRRILDWYFLCLCSLRWRMVTRSTPCFTRLEAVFLAPRCSRCGAAFCLALLSTFPSSKEVFLRNLWCSGTLCHCWGTSLALFSMVWYFGLSWLVYPSPNISRRVCTPNDAPMICFVFACSKCALLYWPSCLLVLCTLCARCRGWWFIFCVCRGEEAVRCTCRLNHFDANVTLIAWLMYPGSLVIVIGQCRWLIVFR